MLKRLVFFPFFLFAYDENILNELKKNEFNYEKKYFIENSKELSKSWLNPINLSYSINKTNLSPERTTKSFTISVNQPIFKSGAIYYSIKYANDLKSYNLKNIEIKKRELIKEALNLAIDYKINQLNREIIKLEMKNTNIDIIKRKEAFLNGVGDSTLLNNAVLKLNSLKLNLADIDLTLFKIKKNFKKISSMDIEKVVLPKFKIIEKKDYVNKNLNIIKTKENIKIKKDSYKINLGNSLFSINLNTNYNLVKNNYKQNLPTLDESSYIYYNLGFSINFPIQFNSINVVEKSKIDYLKSQIELNDEKNILSKEYDIYLNEVKTVDKKIKIYKENVKVYDSLINSTKDAIKAGDATYSDLEIMQNSRRSSLINIKILKLEKQKILLNLYYNLTIF